MFSCSLFGAFTSGIDAAEPKPYVYRILKQVNIFIQCQNKLIPSKILFKVYENGLNLNVHYILTEFFLPVFMALGFVIALPYVLVHSAIPILGTFVLCMNLLLRATQPWAMD